MRERASAATDHCRDWIAVPATERNAASQSAVLRPPSSSLMLVPRSNATRKALRSICAPGTADEWPSIVCLSGTLGRLNERNALSWSDKHSPGLPAMADLDAIRPPRSSNHERAFVVAVIAFRF